MHDGIICDTSLAAHRALRFFHLPWSFFLCLKHTVIFLTLFCNTDPNYTPQTNRERLHLKLNTSSLSVWHLVFVPMHLNYILTIPACIRGQRGRECVQESVTCLTSLYHYNSHLKQKKEPAESHRTSCSLIVWSKLTFHWTSEIKGLCSQTYSLWTWNQVNQLLSATIE